MKKNLLKIKNNDFGFKSLVLLPNWEIIMGLQFENIVLKNKSFILDSLGLSSDEVVISNPFFQRKTSQYPGCQIDYLIQTRFNTLFVCEIKFKKSPIGTEVITQMQKKISHFQFPKGFSCRPVLIHVNEVDDKVISSAYFSNIIDFSKVLS
jgi:hypothetical protein